MEIEAFKFLKKIISLQRVNSEAPNLIGLLKNVKSKGLLCSVLNILFSFN